jgi:hypothetical protein
MEKADRDAGGHVPQRAKPEVAEAATGEPPEAGAESTPESSLEPKTESASESCKSGAERVCRGLLGNCASGTETCERGAWSACSVEPEGADSCEPQDDADCDGEPTEDCECVEGAERSCAAGGLLGNCAKGTQVCGADGKYGTCSIAPEGADACDRALDDADCDGVANSGCPCTSREEGDPSRECGPANAVGQCKKGISRCIEGTWGACEGAVVEAARDCSSKEDLDCDGAADNSLDEACQCPVGAKRECDAHPNLDGNGACRSGEQTCVASVDGSSSAWSACTGSIGPEDADSCTVVDDGNCNGTPNDGCQCLEGAESTCGAVYQAQGECASRTVLCTSSGNWQSAAECAAQAGQDCGATAQCAAGVFDAEGAVFDAVCFQ